MVDLPLGLQLSDDDFLSFDGPTGAVVALDDSRQTFFHHLGLREDVWDHKVIYWRMKKEAKSAMERLFASRRSLRAEIMEDESIIAPFDVDQISELAFQEQVEMIYKTASPKTLSWYSMMDIGDGKNWVIRWMLWRVLRKAAVPDLKKENSASERDSLCPFTTPSTVADARTEPSISALPAPAWVNTLTPLPPPAIDRGDPGDQYVGMSQATIQRPASVDRAVQAAEPSRRSVKSAPSLKRAAREVDEPDDERPRKVIKTEPDSAPEAVSPCRSSDFWSRVLNT